MSLSVRVRFEVFKRDRFTCAYCGQTPPKVLLEVDHITPRAAGGSDDMDNLVTSCQDCNRGKSDRLLEEGARPAVNQAAIDDLEERIEQARAYAELVQVASRLADRQYGLFVDHWASAFRATLIETDTGSVYRLRADWEEWPNERSVRLFVRKLPLDAILEAVDVAASKFNGISDDGTCRYFYAVCWARIRRAEGR